MGNFEKPLHKFTDVELLEKINQWEPKFGLLAGYELQRRIAVENTKSSKRIARWSFIISVVAILISFAIGGVQIYLSFIQSIPVFQNIAKETRNELTFCTKNVDSDYTYPDNSTTTCRIILRKKGDVLSPPFITLFGTLSASSTLFSTTSMTGLNFILINK